MPIIRPNITVVTYPAISENEPSTPFARFCTNPITAPEIFPTELVSCSEPISRLLSFANRANARIRHFLNDVDEVFSGYIRGQLMDVAFMIVATSTAMMLTGISLAPIIGLLTGLANLVPYLGPFVGYASIILISIVEGKYQVMIASIIALLIIQTLDGNVIEAKFIGKSIKVHPLLVVIFLIFGNAIGGLWGMLLAVPVGAYFQKVFTNYVEKRKNAKKLARAKRNSVVDETDDEAEYVDGSQA